MTDRTMACFRPSAAACRCVGPGKQQGMTLVVGLIMLLLLTMFAVSAIRMSSSSLKTVGNQQQRDEAASAAQSALEQLLSSTDPFSDPETVASPVTMTVNNTDYTVAFATPVCLGSAAIPGNSHNLQGMALQETYWDLQATATSESTGVTLTVHQGVRVRLGPLEDCP